MSQELQQLVRQKIESLRPKLLDLSRRNPLIATKLGARSGSHVRVVDELPDILFFKLNNGQQMEIVPLPPIEEDPRDERTIEFRSALANARLTDEQYLNAMKSVQPESEDYLDTTRQIERALKDRVRSSLGLPPRVNRAELNLAQHAKNNGISPSYELPKANGGGDHPDHSDDKIQTLLLPNDLERRLNGIVTKCRTWLQETGMNVLQAAYGFLEWSENVQSEISFAPLILCQSQIERRRSQGGVRFMISGTGDEPDVNAVLAEKLGAEFGIEIPKFTGASVEEYMAEVGRLAPKNMVWRVRRQVAIGVFPSARMAMYKDLDTTDTSFPENAIVESLLAGSNSTASSPFADEYEIDLPEIESKVPCLVMDADSSQFSTLVDVADGKNVAVEGPPGTGKSQTIVNAIAAALAEGKKVLFVAEKLAALNVVKSRLEAVGLGEFLLPLQAERSGREQVIQSIRDRLEIRDASGVRDYDEKIRHFRRTREQLARYIELLTAPVEGSGFTVRDVIGKSIATNWKLDDLPRDIVDDCRIPSALKTRSGLLVLRQAGAQVEKAYSETACAKPHWKQTQLADPDRFTIEESCALAGRAAEEARKLARARVELERVGLESDSPIENLKSALKALEGAAGLLGQAPASMLSRLLEGDDARLLESFISRCLDVQRATAELSKSLRGEPTPAMLDGIGETLRACNELGLRSIDPEALAAERHERTRSGQIARAVSRAIEPLVSARSEAKSWRLSDIGKAHELLKTAGRGVLALRSRKDMPAAAVHLLRKLCEEGRKLASERTALSEKISFASDVPVVQLSDCLATLRAAGPLRGLSPRYRSAKRIFLSISKSPKYLRQSAVANLETFISFRQRENDFEVRATSSSLFGPFYRGLDTEFEFFLKLAEFYDGIDSTFTAVEHRTLRSFLREADANELDLVPALPITGLRLHYEDLGDRISEIEADVRRLQEGERRCGACIGFLRDRAVSPESLAEIVGKLEFVMQQRGPLESDSMVSALIGPLFKGSRTSCGELQALLSWSGPAKLFARLFRDVSSAADLDDARTRVETVLLRHDSYSETIARLNRVAKIDLSELSGTVGFMEAAAELERAAQDPHGLLAHATLRSVLNEVEPHGVITLVRHRSGGASLGRTS
jgi:hypothetical protein